MGVYSNGVRFAMHVRQRSRNFSKIYFFIHTVNSYSLTVRGFILLSPVSLDPPALREYGICFIDDTSSVCDKCILSSARLD